jgi:hypothetical protein
MIALLPCKIVIYGRGLRAPRFSESEQKKRALEGVEFRFESKFSKN